MIHANSLCTDQYASIICDATNGSIMRIENTYYSNQEINKLIMLDNSNKNFIENMKEIGTCDGYDYITESSSQYKDFDKFFSTEKTYNTNKSA